MKRSPSISATLSFLLCLASAFLLPPFTFFFPTMQQPHPLVTSTHDLISKAKSSSTFMFFACNLIIITIILISTRPNEEDELGQYLAFVEEQWQCMDIDSSNGCRCREEAEIDIDGPCGDRRNHDEDDQDGSLDDGGYDYYSNCDSDDSAELHKRIEEFIAKTLNKWREERLRDTQMRI